MAQVILFEHSNFHGAHRHVFGWEPNLNAEDDRYWNDRVSSLAVLSGAWSFYRDAGYGGRYGRTLGPGGYSWVEAVDIKNDEMSSLHPVSDSGVATLPHVILFEHANFHGAHKHVLGWEPNLNAEDDSFFNDRVSSLVTLVGSWMFYRDAGYIGQYPRSLGPGSFPWVEAIDIKNDDMSSLHQTTSSGTNPTPHVILFEHANFHGAHKHVFGAEPNLAASDDSFYNDRVSSVVVLAGTWAFFRDVNYRGQYARALGPGYYPSIEAMDIKNDDMSSLRPV